MQPLINPTVLSYTSPFIMTTVAVFQWIRSQPLPLMLIFLILLDMLSGFIAGCVTKTISSDASYNGAWRKTMIVLIVGACAAIDPLCQGFPVFKMSCFFYIYNEALSLLENAVKAGVPVPQEVKDILLKLREKPNLPSVPQPPVVQNMTVNNGPATINVVPDVPSSSGPIVTEQPNTIGEKSKP